MGLLESVTAQTTAKVIRQGVYDREITEPMTNYTVARIQKNWDGNTLVGGMVTSVNRNLTKEHLRDVLIGNAFSAGMDVTHYFANRLYYIDVKGMFSTLHGSPAALLKTKTNAVHYFHRESGADYLGLHPESRSMQGTGGYVKVGKRGNAQWNFSQLFSWASPGFDLNDVGFMRQSDYKLNESEIAFRKTDPWGPFRFAGINLTQRNVWNYGGDAINNDVALRWRSLSIAHRIEMDIKETFSWNTVDSRRLRGGPDLRYNANFETNVSLSTDRAKRVVYKLIYDGRHYLDEETGYNQVHPGIIFRIGNHMRLTGQFDYAWNHDDLQYVSSMPPVAANGGTTYVMGRMKQQTYGVTMNMQVNVTPDISIQYYGSPFTSVASYDNFKLAAATRSRNFSDRFLPLADGQLTFPDPDFSFNELRSNLVARWEYFPGSTLYLVWQHNRSSHDNSYHPGWESNLDRLFALPATNAFMMKINYWFSR